MEVVLTYNHLRKYGASIPSLLEYSEKVDVHRSPHLGIRLYIFYIYLCILYIPGTGILDVGGGEVKALVELSVTFLVITVVGAEIVVVACSVPLPVIPGT